MRDEPQYTPPADLASFLASGPPPLYVGFGSIVLDDPERLTNVILEATRKCGVRVIISRGWSKLGGNSPNSDSVFYLDDCPHGEFAYHLLWENNGADTQAQNGSSRESRPWYITAAPVPRLAA